MRFLLHLVMDKSSVAEEDPSIFGKHLEEQCDRIHSIKRYITRETNFCGVKRGVERVT